MAKAVKKRHVRPHIHSIYGGKGWIIRCYKCRKAVSGATYATDYLKKDLCKVTKEIKNFDKEKDPVVKRQIAREINRLLFWMKEEAKDLKRVDFI